MQRAMWVCVLFCLLMSRVAAQDDSPPAGLVVRASGIGLSDKPGRIGEQLAKRAGYIVALRNLLCTLQGLPEGSEVHGTVPPQARIVEEVAVDGGWRVTVELALADVGRALTREQERASKLLEQLQTLQATHQQLEQERSTQEATQQRLEQRQAELERDLARATEVGQAQRRDLEQGGREIQQLQQQLAQANEAGLRARAELTTTQQQCAEQAAKWAAHHTALGEQLALLRKTLSESRDIDGLRAAVAAWCDEFVRRFAAAERE